MTPLIIVAALIAGVMGMLALPREEEPQIVVPMVDIMVSDPGASAQEVESRVVKPLEKLLNEVKGVEYIYSTSMPGQAMFIVRFYVNENEESSLVKLYHKLSSHPEALPPGASQPLIKLRSIYDVPMMAMTVWSDKYSPMELKRIVNQVSDEHQSDERGVGSHRHRRRSNGKSASISIPVQLAGYHLSPGAVAQSIHGANQQVQAGMVANDNKAIAVQSGQLSHQRGRCRRIWWWAPSAGIRSTCAMWRK